MDQHKQIMPRRSIAGVLNETFAVYGKHFGKFISLVALVQLPTTLIVLCVLMLGSGGNISTIIHYAAVSLGTVFGAGATVVAVSQHYLTGNIRISACYRKTWQKVISLFSLGAILMLFYLGLTIWLQRYQEITLSPENQQPWDQIILPAALVVMIIIAVYWFMSVQAVIVEGTKMLSALRRSYKLVKGNWWKVFTRLSIVLLVGLGLSILLILPLVLVGIEMLGADRVANLGTAPLSASWGLVEIIVLPVFFIFLTLVYYDLRVRKEEYDLLVLSKEMTIATI